MSIISWLKIFTQSSAYVGLMCLNVKGRQIAEVSIRYVSKPEKLNHVYNLLVLSAYVG